MKRVDDFPILNGSVHPFFYGAEVAVNVVLALIVVFSLVLSGVWDVYAHFFLPPGNTVSDAIWTGVSDHPSVGLLVGVLIGHLFFPLRIR